MKKSMIAITLTIATLGTASQANAGEAWIKWLRCQSLHNGNGYHSGQGYGHAGRRAAVRKGGYPVSYGAVPSGPMSYGNVDGEFHGDYAVPYQAFPYHTAPPQAAPYQGESVIRPEPVMQLPPNYRPSPAIQQPAPMRQQFDRRPSPRQVVPLPPQTSYQRPPRSTALPVRPWPSQYGMQPPVSSGFRPVHPGYHSPRPVERYPSFR